MTTAPFKRNENHGPILSETDHAANYEHMKLYSKADEVASNDYILCGTVKGVTYWTPNDEDWGTIIAIDETNELAADTGFYEMDDIEATHGEYAFVASNGKLVCGFEA